MEKFIGKTYIKTKISALMRYVCEVALVIWSLEKPDFYELETFINSRIDSQFTPRTRYTLCQTSTSVFIVIIMIYFGLVLFLPGPSTKQIPLFSTFFQVSHCAHTISAIKSNIYP